MSSPLSISTARELSLVHHSNSAVLHLRKDENYHEMIKPYLQEIINQINLKIVSVASTGRFETSVYFPISQDVVPIKTSLFLHLQELYAGYRVFNVNKSSEPLEFGVIFNWYMM